MAQPFKKIGAVLKQIAPTVLAGMSGPAAPLVLGLAKSFLGDDAAAPGGLERVLEAALGSPEGIAKIQELELEAKKLEANTGIRFAELEVEDRKDARALAAMTSIIPQSVLSAFYTFGYFWAMWLYLTGRVVMLAPEQNAMVTTLVGALTAVQIQILNFWFGSSSGSKDKTAVNAALAASGKLG
jgi:hypothetical protein